MELTYIQNKNIKGDPRSACPYVLTDHGTRCPQKDVKIVLHSELKGTKNSEWNLHVHKTKTERLSRGQPACRYYWPTTAHVVRKKSQSSSA